MNHDKWVYKYYRLATCSKAQSLITLEAHQYYSLKFVNLTLIRLH